MVYDKQRQADLAHVHICYFGTNPNTHPVGVGRGANSERLADTKLFFPVTSIWSTSLVFGVVFRFWI